MNIYQYWDNPLKASDLIRMCMESVPRNNPSHNITQIWDGEGDHCRRMCDQYSIPPDKVFAMKPQHRADLMRLYLLSCASPQTVNCWLDSDYLSFNQLDEAEHTPKDANTVVMVMGHDTRPCNDHMSMGTNMAHQLLQGAIIKLETCDWQISWHEIGADLLDALHPEHKRMLIPDKHSWGRMFNLDLELPHESWKPHPAIVGMMVMNSKSGTYLADKSKDELLKGENIIGACLRHAFRG